VSLEARVRAAARPLICGHRGSPATAPENTLASISQALDAGVDAVEFDVHLSADAVCVLIHDDTVDRTSDGSGPVSQLTYAQLRALDAGSWKDVRFAGERIPSLEEALALIAGRTPAFIEVKADFDLHPDAVVAVAREVRAAGAGDDAVLLAFDHRHIEHARADTLGLECVALCVEPPPDVAALLQATGAVGLAPQWRHVDAALCGRVHDAGATMVTWTVDTPDDARTLARYGLDVLITNRPAEMIAELRS
jgi:glycerophosphoryl diester phosphodiesterase